MSKYEYPEGIPVNCLPSWVTPGNRIIAAGNLLGFNWTIVRYRTFHDWYYCSYIQLPVEHHRRPAAEIAHNYSAFTDLMMSFRGVTFVHPEGWIGFDTANLVVNKQEILDETLFMCETLAYDQINYKKEKMLKYRDFL